MKKKIAIVALAGTLGLSALPALAHHSFTMFDSTKSITINGTVKAFEYANPHAWLLVDVKGSGGSVTTWAFQMGELSSLTRAGIHKQDFMPGMQVAITAQPMKDGRPAGNFTKAVRADGQVFTPRGRAAAQQPAANQG